MSIKAICLPRLNNRFDSMIDSELAQLAIDIIHLYARLLFKRLIITADRSLCEEILEWSHLSATCIEVNDEYIIRISVHTRSSNGIIGYTNIRCIAK